MRTAFRMGALTVLAGAMGLVASPAFAAPGPSNGTQELTFDCDGSAVTILTRANASHAEQNWAAAYVVELGTTAVPVSFSFSLIDTTAGVTLADETAAHPNAHQRQQTITCSHTETDTLGNVVPPDAPLPPGTSLSDEVALSITVVAALPGSFHA